MRAPDIATINFAGTLRIIASSDIGTFSNSDNFSSVCFCPHFFGFATKIQKPPFPSLSANVNRYPFNRNLRTRFITLGKYPKNAENRDSARTNSIDLTHINRLLRFSDKRHRPDLIGAGFQLSRHNAWTIHLSVHRYYVNTILTESPNNCIDVIL